MVGVGVSGKGTRVKGRGEGRRHDRLGELEHEETSSTTTESSAVDGDDKVTGSSHPLTGSGCDSPVTLWIVVGL